MFMAASWDVVVEVVALVEHQILQVKVQELPSLWHLVVEII